MKKLLLLLTFILSTTLYGAVDCTKASNTQEFVKRFYSVILGRTADNVGMDGWTNDLLKRSKTGADVAQGFIFSVEYNLDSKSNTQYLNDLYSAFFDRTADTAGFDDWMSQLNAENSRDDVLHGFLYSQEFINLSNSYGIQAYAGAAFESEEITNFVKRFYSVILGRVADSGGLSDWSNRLSTGAATGADIARGFIFSVEYNLDSKSNTQYLNDLYSAFFNRAADTAGFNGWMTQLNANTSRSDVLDGFLGSQEFINLTNSYGILAFTGAPVPPNTNTPPTANAGADQNAFLGANVTLDGSGSTDSDGSISCYWWKTSTTLLSTNQTHNTSTLPIGINTLTLTVVDDSGETGSDDVVVSVEENIIDTIKPIITLIGDKNMTIEVGSIYNDAGASAIDNIDGDITNDIIIGNPVDTSVIGEYTVTYNVTDEAGNHANTVSRVVHIVAAPNGYADLGSYTPVFYSNNKVGNQKYIAYYPENGISADMPVMMFIKGGGASTIEGYSGIMKFLASKGYYVIGVDTNSYDSWYVTKYLEIALNEVKAMHGLNVSKLAILGHSLGGGQAFYAMKKFRDDGYGNAGSLALSIDGWFAFNMDQIDLNLLDTKVSFLQMNGVHGTGTDPRIHLKIWNLSTQSDRSFYTLPSNQHSYVAGNLANVLAKQDLLFSIGALTDDAFKGVNDGATAIPMTNKATYSDIRNALQAEDTYHGGDCKGKQYNAISVIKNNNINYCDFESSYPPETTLTKKVVNSVDRPLEKFSSYLEVAFDNTVQRKVTRVTNREQDNKGFNSHQYPKQGSAWNSDMSLLRLQGRVYDAETLVEIPLTITKTGGEVYSLMKAPQSGSSGIRWSKHDANILYVMSADKKFYKLTISPDKTTLSEEVIIDLSASARPYFNIGQNEGNIDYEDKYVVLTSLDGNDTYATLLDIKNKNLVWGPVKLNFLSADFDWMSISPSGNYILISANSIIRLYNRNLDFIRVLANRAEHGDIGYDQNGSEMYVQFHSGGVGIFGFILNTNPNYEDPIKLLDSNHGGGHISCRNYKRKGWCYVGTREDGYREVYALKLDGSKTVQRFAKTNARGAEDPILGDATHYHYATHPTAVPSPYGSRVLFWSDYGNSEGFLYVYKDADNKWHTTTHYYNRDTYQVRITK